MRLLLIAIFLTATNAYALDIPKAKNIGGKVINTSWMETALIKGGFVGSLCLYQSLNGITEGYHFRQGNKTWLVKESNYHAWATGQRFSGVIAGWSSYALVRNNDLTWKKKVCVVLGGALIARNCFEWGYKFTRYHNAFDYSEEHNKNALMAFKITRHGIEDVGISLGSMSGPLVDIGCLLVGYFLIY